MWSSASSKELRMSLPITAVGPLKVETNPILMESAAWAVVASARAVAPASQNAVLMSVLPPRYLRMPSIDRLVPFREPPNAPFPARSIFISGCVFCARNRRPAASTNRWLPLELPARRKCFMHHNSYKPEMARIIVLVGSGGRRAKTSLEKSRSLRSDQEFRAIDDIGRVAEVADIGDFVRGPLQQDEIFRRCAGFVGIEHQDGRTPLDESRHQVPVGDL